MTAWLLPRAQGLTFPDNYRKLHYIATPARAGVDQGFIDASLGQIAAPPNVHVYKGLGPAAYINKYAIL